MLILIYLIFLFTFKHTLLKIMIIKAHLELRKYVIFLLAAIIPKGENSL